MSKKFENKVVVVTGGTSGIGLATAKQFANEGASVFITGRRQDALDAAVKAIGGRVTGVRADMAQLGDIDRLYDAVQQQHDRIDVVFANAGGGEFAPLGAITEEHFDKTFATNVKGVLFTVQKALPLLRDGGSVTLTSSTTGTTGTPAFSMYSATKAAVRNFARNWALDLKDRHIRVNAISPGVTERPGSTTCSAAAPKPKPSRRVLSPESRRAGSDSRKKSPMPCCSSPPTRQATSTVSSCSSMAASLRYDDTAPSRAIMSAAAKSSSIQP
jgi:NAD(P)-dependent dehydrogenase (short-subunit alcohol dehydrogenase family)